MTADDFERLLPDLKMRLRALASRSRREAPPSVEAALVAEFRRRHFRARARRVTRWYWMGAAAAACLLVAAGLTRFERRTAPQALPVVVAKSPEVVQPEVRLSPAPAKRIARRVPQRKVKPSPATAPVSRPEMVTAFIPVSYGAAPAEEASMVRVRLPRSALLSFGFPMNVERAAEPVIADVLLGEDGVARAIRFVR